MKHLRLFLPIALPLILFGLFFTTLQTKASPSATFTVNSTVDAVDVNPGDGECETAVPGQCTLRAAIQETNALPGEDTIQLGTNTYLLTIAGINEDAAATGDLDITDMLTIEGNGSSLTIINGNRLDRVFDVKIDASLTIKGVMVTNGWLDTGLFGSAAGGSGILNSSSLTIENSSVFSNTAHTISGGGVYNNGGTITITNSTIISNAITGNTGREGGGIANFSGSLRIESSEVANNLGGFGYGGGIFSMQNIIISDTVITNNDADYGGGLSLGGSALVINSIISDNMSISGTSDAGYGGGIYYESSTGELEITNSTIFSNTSQRGAGIYLNGAMTMTTSQVTDNFVYGNGGGMFAIFSNLTISDSTFDHNKTFAAGFNFGGGIYATGFFGSDKFNMSGSTINNNSAGTAAGIYLSSGSHTIQNSTFAYNETTDTMGLNTSSAIRVSAGQLTLENSTVALNSGLGTTDGAIVTADFATITVTNSIIANNNGGDCNSFGMNSQIVSGDNNLSSDNSCNFSQPSDLPNTAPRLGPLQNNGGQTETFAPLENSPVIDAGNNANCLATDQRGVSRPIDGDGDGTAVCDIGAVEVGAIAATMQYLYLPIVVKP